MNKAYKKDSSIPLKHIRLVREGFGGSKYIVIAVKHCGFVGNVWLNFNSNGCENVAEIGCRDHV